MLIGFIYWLLYDVCSEMPSCMKHGGIFVRISRVGKRSLLSTAPYVIFCRKIMVYSSQKQNI